MASDVLDQEINLHFSYFTILDQPFTLLRNFNWYCTSFERPVMFLSLNIYDTVTLTKIGTNETLPTTFLTQDIKRLTREVEDCTILLYLPKPIYTDLHPNSLVSVTNIFANVSKLYAFDIVSHKIAENEIVYSDRLENIRSILKVCKTGIIQIADIRYTSFRGSTNYELIQKLNDLCKFNTLMLRKEDHVVNFDKDIIYKKCKVANCKVMKINDEYAVCSFDDQIFRARFFSEKDKNEIKNCSEIKVAYWKYENIIKSAFYISCSSN